MITILLQKILAALTQLLGDIKTKLNTIKDNLDDLIVVATASGPIASFTTTITKPFISCNIEILPKQAAGTPSPSNPLPISGTDTVIITQTGANFWDEQWELGSISTTNGSLVVSTTTIRSKNKIKVVAGSKYSIVKPSGQQIFILFYDKNDTPIQYVQASGDSLVAYNIAANISQLSTNGTFTVPSGTDYILFRYDGTNTYSSGVSINYPSTDTTYHAHVTATTKTVSLPETVYGGEVDVIGGSGKSEKALIDFGDQTLTWAKSPSVPNCFFSSVISGANATGTQEVLSSIYAYSSAPTGSMPNETIKMYQGRLYVIDDDYATADAFVTGATGQKVLYPLATPTPITLANPITITALDGVNNVFGDTDGNTTVQYLKKYKED